MLPAVCLECYLLGTFLWLFFVALHRPEQRVIDLQMPGFAVCLLRGATFSVRRRLAPVSLWSFLPTCLPSTSAPSRPPLFPAAPAFLSECTELLYSSLSRVLNAPSALLIPGVSGGLPRAWQALFICVPALLLFHMKAVSFGTHGSCDFRGALGAEWAMLCKGSTGGAFSTGGHGGG